MADNSNVSKEFIKELFFVDSLEQRRLELFNQIYGEAPSFASRKIIYRDCEAGHERLERYYFVQNTLLVYFVQNPG